MANFGKLILLVNESEINLSIKIKYCFQYLSQELLDTYL
ncbi:hypothetical protein RINTHM_8300 [Richelia intracellularis HM01]|nr:hypothetical protein RINTHM_8300 [Richelia intracellularis HM01]